MKLKNSVKEFNKLEEMKGYSLTGVNKTEKRNKVRNMEDEILAKKEHQGLNLTTAVAYSKLYKNMKQTFSQ